MKVRFRADASETIGTGHRARCEALAMALADRGASIAFISRGMPAGWADRLANRGFAVTPISNDDDGLAAAAAGRFDLTGGRSYGIDASWVSAVRASLRAMVIDDLADRSHNCDVLLDQTFGEDGARHSSLVPVNCRELFGSSYELLRTQSAAIRGRGLPAHPSTDRVHLFLGSGTHWHSLA